MCRFWAFLKKRPVLVRSVTIPGLEQPHLLLLAQDHLHPVHGHDDAHLLLLNVLGFEFILVGRKNKFKRVLEVPGTVCGSQCLHIKMSCFGSIPTAEGGGNLFYSAEKKHFGKDLVQ